ncbi:FbpB family small basic protein [Cytobacillus sp. FJAT-54145]|uniref:FbpB family small basic protein n=1 Tax=Cytobacillus spartinae TaxID=3299023 RepID=A0ABW6KF00_9BACI
MKRVKPSLNDLINKNKEELLKNREKLELIEIKVEEKYVNTKNTSSKEN